MKNILFAIVMILVAASIATSLRAADVSTSPDATGAPVVNKPQPVAEAAAQRKAARLRERNRKAKASSGTLHGKSAAPVTPAASGTPATVDNAGQPAGTKPAAAVDHAAQRKAARLRERNIKARAQSGTDHAAKPSPAVPAAPAVK